MLRGFILFAAALFGLVGSSVCAAPLPIETWGHLPSVDNVSVSPDGNRLVMVVGNSATRQVQIRKTDTLAIETVLPFGNAKLRAVVWGDSNHLIFVSGQTAAAIGIEGPKREWNMAFVYDLAHKKMRSLLQSQDQAMNVVEGVPFMLTIKGHSIAFIKGISFPGSRGVLTLFRQDLDGGMTSMVMQGNENTQDFLVDDDGHVVAREDYRDTSGIWELFSRRGSGLVRSLAITAPLDPPNLEGFDADKNTLLVSTPSAGDNGSTYRRIALGTDHWLDANDERGEGNRIEDRVTHLTLGYEREGLDAADYHFLAPVDQKLWGAITRAFPHDVVRLASWSADRKIVILQVEGEHGAAYFLLNMADHRADFLANEYQDIDADQVAPVHVIHYKAADGFDIPAYLTLPHGTPGSEKLPLIVLVHGGPAARDYPGFDWWSQALASRGYAVLQPQYRGSDGYGDHFLSAGYGEWGHKMQSDVSDGVRDLAAKGLIDPARVCIVGASYGGYAALAGVTLEKGVYKCAVSLAGPADMSRFLSWSKSFHEGYSGGLMRYWQRFTGANSMSDPKLGAISPLQHVDKADVPVLLMHGTDDTVVSFEQSKMMADALTKAGHPPQFVRLTGEDHWLSRSQTRIEMLRAMETFLDAQLPAKPPSVAAGGADTAAGHPH